MRQQFRRAAWLALWFTAAAPTAHAHAPLARGLSIAPDGSGMALRMPGFGLLVGGGAQPSFAYACDALFELQPHEASAPVTYGEGGVLLVGTELGLRAASPDGCPRAAQTGELADVPVVALATHPSDTKLIYAVTGGNAPPALYRSRDGGAHWELRSSLANAGGVTALVLDRVDPDVIYVSRTGGADDSGAIARSEDGGATFTVVEQERAIVLLHAASGTTPQLWAMARTGAVRGVDILRAERPEGPWQSTLQVNFFGGFTTDAETGAIWVGDEGGGVYRSSDGGDSFENVAPKAAVACLAHAHGALWACTPGTAQQPALKVWREPGGFEPVAAFADVDRLIECAEATEVPLQCAAAWAEWRADVLGRAPAAEGAGTTGEAGAGGMGMGEAGSAGTQDAAPASAGSGTDEPTPQAPDARSSAAACSSSAAGTRPSSFAAYWLFAAAAFLRCCRAQIQRLGRRR